MFEETQKSEKVGNMERTNAQVIVTRVQSIPMIQTIPAVIYDHLGGHVKQAFDSRTSRGVASGH